MGLPRGAENGWDCEICGFSEKTGVGGSLVWGRTAVGWDGFGNDGLI